MDERIYKTEVDEQWNEYYQIIQQGEESKPTKNQLRDIVKLCLSVGIKIKLETIETQEKANRTIRNLRLLVRRTCRYPYKN